MKIGWWGKVFFFDMIRRIERYKSWCSLGWVCIILFRKYCTVFCISIVFDSGILVDSIFRAEYISLTFTRGSWIVIAEI